MNPSVIKAAKAIPGQLQKVVGAMFSESDQDLKRAVGELRQALRTVDEYARDLDGAAPRGPGRPPGRPRAAAPAAGPAGKPGRRGRRRGHFPTGEFVIQQLRSNPKGLRPRDIAEKLEVAAKGKHSSALSTVNTTLGRLKQIGVARSTDGTWKLTGKGAAPAAKE
jgi:hypothetical protein